MKQPLLASIKTVDEINKQMTTPSAATKKIISEISDEIMILGVGGKMGPTLAEMIIRAGGKVIGVDVFPDEQVQKYLDKIGVRTIKCDLFDDEQIQNIPEVENIFLMVGTKFGATGNEPFVWTMNSFLPGKLMEQFSCSNTVYISSGNVYKFTPVSKQGAVETDEVEPIGEYAMSRLGGERVVEYHSKQNNTPACIVRLFYSTELRYGVIHDIAAKIRDRIPIDLSMGYFNQIWQGDACDYIVQCLSLCSVPSTIINLTGPELLSIRTVANRLAELMGIEPKFEGTESDSALTGNASQLLNKFGQPSISAEQIIHWVTYWVMHGGESLGKPTKFEKRDGKF